MTKTSIIRTTTTTTTNNNNGELSINDRLPSNNISFQSAIICTIPEINSAFISLYQSNHQNHTNDNDDSDHTITKTATTTATTTTATTTTATTTTAITWKDQMDIRVTGLVLYTDTKHEFIILGDALHQPTIVKRSTLFSHGRVMGVGRASNNSSSNTSNTSNNQTMTLSATPSSSSSSSSSSILLGKKRKLITVKKNTHSSLLLKKNHTNLTYSNNKSPSSSTSTTSTTTSSKSNEKNTTWKLDPIMIKIIEQKRKEGMKMIIIDFKSGMNDVVWKDDDLVMVIGNLSLLTRGSDNNNNGSGSDEDKNMLDDRECYIRSALDLIYHGSSFGRGDQQNQSTCSIGFTNGSGFVTSRIITNVNGTDMNLFQEGLKKRREYLNRISIQ